MRRSPRSNGKAGASSIQCWLTRFFASLRAATASSPSDSPMHIRPKDIADWMKARVSSAGSRGIVVGLSDGIDSAVVIGLAAMATPGQVVGVMLPCHSDPRDEADGQLAADH